MANILKLVRGAVELSLLEEPGFCLDANSDWQAGVAQAGRGQIPPYIVESLPIILKGTSHDDLAARLQVLHAMQEGAGRYAVDRTEETPVWLHAKLDGETGERRALVRDIQFRFGDDWFGEEAGLYTLHGALAIERHPYWEVVTNVTTGNPDNIPCLSGAWDYTAITDVVGDAPARIASMKFIGTTGPHAYAWIGFRSANKHPFLADFEPLWELELGTPGTDAALAADATASPGGAGNTCIDVDFSTTATWAERLRIALGDITPGQQDQHGRFLLLLRAKVDAGTTAQVRFGHIYPGMAAWQPIGQPVEVVASAKWTEYEVGVLTIPMRDPATTAWYPTSYDATQAVVIEARRTGGAGSLYLDCLSLIPIDEYFVYTGYCHIDAGEGVNLHVRPQDVPTGIYYDGAVGILGVAPMIVTGPGVPVGDGRAYVVMADSDKSASLTDTFDTLMMVFPRWLSLRGAG